MSDDAAPPADDNQITIRVKDQVRRKFCLDEDLSVFVSRCNDATE
jgi:hypothetical protein